MKNSTASRDQERDPQFWVDDLPDEYGFAPKSTNTFLSLFKYLMIFMSIYLVFVAVYFMWKLLGAGYTIAFIVIITLTSAYSIYLRRHKQAELKKKALIQVRARELIAADTIGSAVHVAGHPLFERDQPVVLALKNDEFAIHTYQSQVPKDVIHISSIKAVYTVVYDDDRIPHIDVIDDTAQALQMIVSCQGKEYNCLFRRFRKLRAIDWYHELQRVKFRH